jgi:hypothetical protein
VDFLSVLFWVRLMRPFVQMFMSTFSSLQMAYSLLRDVNSNTQSWRVRVRIARYWEHLDAKRDNALLRLQFVMVDEKVIN